MDELTDQRTISSILEKVNDMKRERIRFGAPLRYWMKNELQPLVEDVLSESSLKNRGLFNYQGVKNLMDMDRNGRIDASYTIFALICIVNSGAEYL